MEKIDAKPLAMVAVTRITRITAHFERTGTLPRGWTAQELRATATAADNNISLGSNPTLHHDFAAALRRVADLSLQPGSDTEDPKPDPLTSS